MTWNISGSALAIYIDGVLAASSGATLGSALGNSGKAAAALIQRQYGPEGRLARTWTTRSMALWVLVLLIGYLLLYYI